MSQRPSSPWLLFGAEPTAYPATSIAQTFASSPCRNSDANAKNTDFVKTILNQAIRCVRDLSEDQMDSRPDYQALLTTLQSHIADLLQASEEEHASTTDTDTDVEWERLS